MGWVNRKIQTHRPRSATFLISSSVEKILTQRYIQKLFSYFQIQATPNSSVRIISLMFLALLLTHLAKQAVCLGDSLVDISLVKTSFLDGRDVAQVGSGAIVDIAYVKGTISEMSVISAVEMGSALIRGTSSMVTIRDCTLVELKNRWTTFSGSKVVVETSSFRDSLRPFTVAQNNSAQKTQESFTSSIALDGCYFTDCADAELEGGGICCKAATGYIILTSCHFQNCKCGNGWGDAVYASVRQFWCRSCEFRDMVSTYSVLHFDSGASDKLFSDTIEFSWNTFNNITVKSTDGTTTEFPQCGGSGIAIRFLKTINIASCTFTDCKLTSSQSGGGAVKIEAKDDNTPITVTFKSCTFTRTKAENYGGAIAIEKKCTTLAIEQCTFSDNKGSQSDVGGFVCVVNDLTTLSLTLSTFTNGDAANVGCICCKVAITDFNVNNCTFDSCGSRGSDRPYSIDLQATSVSLTKLCMRNMPGGYGMIRVSQNGFATDQLITLSGCTFETFNTTVLFTSTASSNSNQWKLTLDSCVFTGITVSGSNFLAMASSNSMNVKELTLTGCRFENISSKYALLLANDGAKCEITSCRFTNISTTATNYIERVLTLTGVTTVIMDDVQFSSMTNRKGIVDLGKSGGSVSLNQLRFESVTVSGSSTEPHLRVYAGTLQKFSDCQFISCTSGSNPIVQLKVAATISNCVFDGCQTSGTQGILLVDFAGVTLQGCTFNNMNLACSVFAASSTVTSLELNNVKFVSVTVPTTANLIQCSGTFPLTVNGLQISNSVFQQVVVSNGQTKIQNSAFSSLTGASAIFTPSASFEFVGCTFTDCNRAVLQGSGTIAISNTAFSSSNANLISVSSGSFSLFNCSWDGCNPVSGSLVLLNGLSAISVENCCFRGGTASENEAAYIRCPDYAQTITTTFELPLCFDLPESQSLDFNGQKPWDEISQQFVIFECQTCDEQATVTFPPSPTEVEETSEISFEPEETSEGFTTLEETSEVATEAEETSEVATETEEASEVVTEPQPTSEAETEPDVTSSTTEVIPTGSDSGAGGKLSSGVVAAVVIVVILVIAVIVVLVVLFVIRRKRQQEASQSSDDEAEMTADTVDCVTAQVTATQEWGGTVTEETTFIAGTDENLNDFPAFEEECI